MSELITKLNPALVMEAMQAPAIIYEKDSIEQLREGTYKSHTYDPSTEIGVIILLDSAIPFDMFSGSPVRKVQLLNITAIADKAFYNCGNLTSIIIPDSVTWMGKSVFTGCTGELTINCPMPDNSDYSFSAFNGAKFTKITIGNGVTSIGSYTFYKCSSLTSITIPDSVTSIGLRAFSGCTSLTSITIPASVTEIGSLAFDGCSSLTRVIITNGVPKIGYSAFSYCTKLTSVTISNSSTKIDPFAFAYCSSLTSVIIPDSVTEIGGHAFSSCRDLTRVTIPDNVTEIGQNALYSCESLTSVTIPNSVTSIGKEAFAWCSNLKEVYCKPTTPPTIDSNIFYKSNSIRKIYVPLNSVEAYKTSPYWSDHADQIVGVVFEDEALESGTNIKTINGNSILGSGDITIEGGGGGNVYTWSAPTDITTGTVTPEEYAAIKEASQVYIEIDGVYYQALKMNVDIYGSLILSVPIILNDSTDTYVATGLCFEILSDLTFSGSNFMVNIPTKTSQLTNDANFVTYANFEWDGSSEGIVTQEKFEELRNANTVIVKQQDGDVIATACKTSGGAVLFYYSATINNVIESTMFIVTDHDYSWTCSTSQTTIPAEVTEATVSGWGFTKNAGTVTGVKINGNTQNPSNGVVDLGYINKQLSPSIASSMTLAPNVYYRNTNKSLSTLTITLGSVSNSNIINEYFVEFTTRDTGTTVSLPSSIKWANGVTPTFENGKTYQISIVNNLGTCVKFG